MVAFNHVAEQANHPAKRQKPNKPPGLVVTRYPLPPGYGQQTALQRGYTHPAPGHQNAFVPMAATSPHPMSAHTQVSMPWQASPATSFASTRDNSFSNTSWKGTAHSSTPPSIITSGPIMSQAPVNAIPPQSTPYHQAFVQPSPSSQSSTPSGSVRRYSTQNIWTTAQPSNTPATPRANPPSSLPPIWPLPQAPNQNREGQTVTREIQSILEAEVEPWMEELQALDFERTDKPRAGPTISHPPNPVGEPLPRG